MFTVYVYGHNSSAESNEFETREQVREFLTSVEIASKIEVDADGVEIENVDWMDYSQVEAWAQENNSMKYQINATEVWDLDFELSVTVNKNPVALTSEEWQELGNWIEDTFPITEEEKSHGFSTGSGKYFFS